DCGIQQKCAAFLRFRSGTAPARHQPPPLPLLLVVTVGDHLVPSELAIAAYDKAHEPKKLVILPGGHFDARGSPFNRSWPGHGLVQGRPSGGLSRPVTSANAVRLAKL